MHLFKFSQAQKTAFLSLALKLMRADEELRAAEVAHFDTICAEMGIERDSAKPERAVAELLQAFDTRDSRVWLMLEILGVGYVDQHFSLEEAAVVNEIVDGLELDPTEIDTMKRIVLRAKGLEAETLRLIEREA